MEHYNQSLVLAAAPATVYAALTTAEGVRGWWTQDCGVATQVGGSVNVRFGATCKSFRIALLDAGREVRWTCTQAHIAAGQLVRRDEWVGTQIIFRLSPLGNDLTRLEFEHVGLVPSFGCYDMCNNGWNHFLTSLQQYVATGRGTPFEIEAASPACPSSQQRANNEQRI